METGLRIIYLMFIARYVSLADYGLWAYGAASYGLALGMVLLGFDFLIANRIGKVGTNIPRFLDATLAVRLMMLALASSGLALFALTVEPPGASRLLLLALIPALIGRGIGLWALHCFLGFEKAHEFLPVTFLVRGGEAVIGILFLVCGGGIVSVIIIHIASRMVEGGAGFLMVRAKLSPVTPRWNTEVRSVLFDGAPLGVNAALTNWMTLIPLVSLRFLGIELALLGVFALALNLTLILISVAQGFLAALVPALSRGSEVGAYANIVALSALLVSIVGAFIALAVAPDVAAWALGEGFRVSGQLMAPLALVGGLAIGATGYFQRIMIAGKIRRAVFVNGGCAVALTVLMVFLTLNWGIWGGVAALAISFGLRLFLAFIFAWRV